MRQYPRTLINEASITSIWRVGKRNFSLYKSLYLFNLIPLTPSCFVFNIKIFTEEECLYLYNQATILIIIIKVLKGRSKQRVQRIMIIQLHPIHKQIDWQWRLIKMMILDKAVWFFKVSFYIEQWHSKRLILSWQLIWSDGVYFAFCSGENRVSTAVFRVFVYLSKPGTKGCEHN